MKIAGKRLSECMVGVSSNVNILKFACAILVILCHCYPLVNGTTDILHRISGTTNFGGFAVAVFFLFSGFYVTKSLDRHKNIAEYIRVRCIRIFPGLATVVLFCIFIYGPIFTKISLVDYFFSKETYLYLLNIFFIPIHNLPGVFENMTYTTINGSLWTMPVEVACYIALLIGFIICSKFKKIKKEHLIYISIIIFICIIVVFRTNSLIVSAVRHMIVFAEGILIYLKRDKIILNVKLAIILSIIFIASIFVGLLTYAIFLLLPYIVLTFTLACKQRLKNVKILNLSYEMYLIGWPIQQVIVYFMGGDMNPILNFAIAVPLDIIVAYGISKMVALIEKKLINRKSIA